MRAKYDRIKGEYQLFVSEDELWTLVNGANAGGDFLLEEAGKLNGNVAQRAIKESGDRYKMMSQRLEKAISEIGE